MLTNALSLRWLVGTAESVPSRLLLMLPFVVLGGWLALKVLARLNTAAFNRAVLWVIAGSGAVGRCCCCAEAQQNAGFHAG